MVEGMLRTALADRHVALGARMAPFAGWEMPLSYAGTLTEHAAVREDVGVFDVSHLGTVWVEGDDASALVDATFTNDSARLTDASGQYSLLCDERGGIVDDLLVYRLDGRRWLVVPNAANTPAVVAALIARARDRGLVDVEVRDESTAWAILAVQGPNALPLVDAILAGRAAAGSVVALPYLGVHEVTGASDADDLIVCRSGYTGERGVEVVLRAEDATALWDALLAGGAVPSGLGARDTLRLEMGYPLHGNDLSTSTRPDVAGLAWAVRCEGRSFPGRDVLADAAAPTRRLRGLTTTSRRPARAEQTVFVADRVVGTTTSGGFSPTLGHGIALAYLDADVAEGDEVDVDVRGERIAHRVVRPPFVDRDPR